MRHMLPQSHQFYVTAPQPCPYLDGKVERKLFTALQGDSANNLNDVLSHQGFRRSQNVLYRPSCGTCTACLSARIVASDFKFSRGQRRILKRNAEVERLARSPWATETQYDLFRRYLDARHATGGMADMDMHEFAAMVEETPVRSRVIEYYRPGENGGRRELIAVCLTDILSDGVSMVYSFFDPDLTRQSLGAYVILDHIRIAQESNLPYVYLGYWVPGSSKMDYKARYDPMEIFADGRWRPVTDADRAPSAHERSEATAIRAQLAAIELPGTK
ncbi:arginyltransferase [Amaricoccus macauensis]|uniref:arginyltransferase n=1 Tax=Amaricoccus macauensis TaxID=57001 RepID=UPI003C7AE2AB